MTEDKDLPQVDWKEASPENHEVSEHWKPLEKLKRSDDDVKWPKLVGEHPGDWD